VVGLWEAPHYRVDALLGLFMRPGVGRDMRQLLPTSAAPKSPARRQRNSEWSHGVEVGGDERQGLLRVTSQEGGRAVAGRYQRLPAGKNGAIRLT
jgi:hypothetical protein